MNIERVVSEYEVGNITGREAGSIIIERVTDDNALEVMKFLGQRCSDLMEVVEQEVRAFKGFTDEQWGKVFILRSWCGPWNEEIKAKVEGSDRERRSLLRQGVAALVRAGIE